MPADNRRMLIIGIDSGDRNLIKRWVESGDLPTFRHLLDTSAWGDTNNSTGMVAGTVWPSFYTGVLPGRTGRFRGTTQFVSGTYSHADIDFGRCSSPSFWDRLSDAGIKSVVVDAPYAFLSEKPNVSQVVDWCSHSAWKDGTTVSKPANWAEEVRGEYGRDPLGKCDFVTLDTVADFTRFRDGLIERINTKRQFTERVLEQGTSLLLNVFSECHCAGHQLWHLHDETHPLYDPAMVAALGGDPLLQIYQAMDAAVAGLLEAADEKMSVMVFCSHGIGPAYTGTHLLDEVLMKIEGRASPRKRQSIAQTMVSIWTKLPRDLRTVLTPLQKLLWPRLKSGLVQPGKANRRFFEIIVNDATGGVRLNLKGREPNGVVEAEEYDGICETVTRELLALINPETGQPLIKRVMKSRDIYPGPRVDQLPDLLVVWDRTGPISESVSESTGRISQKFVFSNHRSGDHTEDDGLVFATGPGIEPGYIGDIPIADLAATLLEAFGVEATDLDGNAVAALIGTSVHDHEAVESDEDNRSVAGS